MEPYDSLASEMSTDSSAATVPFVPKTATFKRPLLKTSAVNLRLSPLIVNEVVVTASLELWQVRKED